MRTETVLTNARVVTADAEFDGTVVVCNGRIAEVARGRSDTAGALDLEGDYLLPGLVELHTDNMEKHFAPRPGVKWPSVSAVMAHDTQISAAGITTVYDSLALGDVHGKSDRVQNRERMIEAICGAAGRQLTRAEHRIHLRCEISAEDAVEAVDKWIDLPLVGLVSINDHTPGQRQFLDPEKLKQYYKGKHAMTDEQFEEFSVRVTALHHKNAARHRSEIVSRAHARALPIASHDDATEAHVREAVANGMTIAEFPTTREAAQASRDAGLAVLVGAPNVVLGGSHSGNIAAIDLLRIGHAEILSSDYVPASLMESLFKLPASDVGIALPQAVRLASLNPARAVGLGDRGEIAADRRADLVRVRAVDNAPVVRAVWREGDRVV
ncbi:MAG: alpha-D-ribose 1-methylphosphonate 5-triphosphate diphosphatase [Reyranella sp.]|jgi:alpha-D-ribose 1-methylphosphonate 5-triphosphate diphosphatase|uniref:alpha-D-ribose 1-methylphosphonate 5-triphosphate diphosphatase n=1 Tax=Reyranella sp. TaxID=1929291 RepID=UPI0025E22995|nr:alpha-D-ribose 1-methylphosphonate 5-triphosphate diphosphatase [Reyranella sp.]MBR2816007.1 alpha-D-ribose 1-methylphosphonate 5-triphosphate diphosphatase [Reyranella sp.]